MEKIQPVFCEYIPEELEEGKLYISQKYGAILHKCPCGCGNKVSTPFDNPYYAWKLDVKEDKVSLYPSIGNWCFPCKSHYWIKENEIIWA